MPFYGGFGACPNRGSLTFPEIVKRNQGHIEEESTHQGKFLSASRKWAVSPSLRAGHMMTRPALTPSLTGDSRAFQGMAAHSRTGKKALRLLRGWKASDPLRPCRPGAVMGTRQRFPWVRTVLRAYNGVWGIPIKHMSAALCAHKCRACRTTLRSKV